jgi:hypothetical protein
VAEAAIRRAGFLPGFSLLHFRRGQLSSSRPVTRHRNTNYCRCVATTPLNRSEFLIRDNSRLRQVWNYFPTPTFFFGLAKERGNVMLSTILIIILILLLIGALPTWPYSAGWGYYPGGGLGIILVIVLILVLVGRI